MRLRCNRPAETEKARRGTRGFENRDWCLVAASAASLTVAGNRMTRTHQDERGLEEEEKGGRLLISWDPNGRRGYFRHFADEKRKGEKPGGGWIRDSPVIGRWCSGNTIRRASNKRAKKIDPRLIKRSSRH